MKLRNFFLLSTLFLIFINSRIYATPIPVVTSFSILGDVTQQIGGDRISVQTLIAPDQDAHVYQLSSKDLINLRRAKLILFNGLGFEPLALQRAAQQSHIPIYYATQNIQSIPMNDSHNHHPHEHDESDPHVWNDPVLMHIYAENIADALISIDPAGKIYYQQRLNKYQQQLNELNNWAAKLFAAIPAANRKVLTGHDAFGYMARRYHIEFIAPQGASTEAEPSARQVAAIIRQIRDQHIKAVFTENIKDPRMIKRIANETGVHISGQLYSDALSKDDTAATYIKMFRHNVETLSNAMK